MLSRGFVRSMAVGALWLAAVILSCPISGCRGRAPAAVAVPEDVAVDGRGQVIDNYLTRVVPFGFSGTVLVADGGEVILNKGYGHAIDSGSTPNTASTVLSCGSVTKQFTAAAIMKLQMQGKLRTSDSLAVFFDDVPADKQGITLRQVLSHSAGLINFTGSDYESTERDEALDSILRAPLRFVPGTDYAYSNAGYSLLAAIIEKVSGRSYEEYLYRELFAPSGMNRTGYRRPDWENALVAHWYAGSEDFGTPLEKPYPYWNLLGNGDMLSTTADMYRWHLALAGYGIVDSASEAEMFSPVAGDYAYGWRIVDSRFGHLAGHSGASDFGSSCQFWRGLDSNIVVVVFANRDYQGQALAGLVSEKVQTILGDDALDIPPAVTGGDGLDPGALAGRYQLPDGTEILAAAAPGALIITGTNQRAIDLLCYPALADPDTHVVLNERVETLAKAVLRREWEGLQALLSDSEARFPRIKAFMEALLSGSVDPAGSTPEVHVVGTFPSAYRSGLVETVVEIGGGEAPASFRFIWENNLIVGLGVAGDRRSVRVPFVPDESGRLIGYHLAVGKVIVADITYDGTGAVSGLEFAQASGRVLAVRR